MKLHKVAAIEIPRYPILRLTFDDGFSGEVDFSEIVAGGGVMTVLRDPVVFARVKIADGGRALGWFDEQETDIDFCADAMRLKAEQQVVRDRAARYAAANPAAAE